MINVTRYKAFILEQAAEADFGAAAVISLPRQEGVGQLFQSFRNKESGAISHNSLFPSHAEKLQSWLLRFAGYRPSRFFSVKVTILLLTGIIIRAWTIEATGIADASGLGIGQAPASQ